MAILTDEELLQASQLKALISAQIKGLNLKVVGATFAALSAELCVQASQFNIPDAIENVDNFSSDMKRLIEESYVGRLN